MLDWTLEHQLFVFKNNTNPSQLLFDSHCTKKQSKQNKNQTPLIVLGERSGWGYRLWNAPLRTSYSFLLVKCIINLSSQLIVLIHTGSWELLILCVGAVVTRPDSCPMNAPSHSNQIPNHQSEPIVCPEILLGRFSCKRYIQWKWISQGLIGDKLIRHYLSEVGHDFHNFTFLLNCIRQKATFSLKFY